MKDKRLPLTVIAGYLGAGKTTLINQMLSAPHGRRIMVFVNDFGAINIDTKLLESANEDTLTLTNGCVCCTMGADLYMAMADMLERVPRPDHLIIEASGIAAPQKIANAAMAEPEMRYGGIITVLDGINGEALLNDEQIGAQIRDQIACADVIYPSKTDILPKALKEMLRAENPNAVLLHPEKTDICHLLLTEHEFTPFSKSDGAHPRYQQWSYNGDKSFPPKALEKFLTQRPNGILRVKGFVKGPQISGQLVQVVGKDISLTPVPQPEKTELIAIAPASLKEKAKGDEWWQQLFV